MHHRNVAMLLRAEKLQRTPVHVSQTPRGLGTVGKEKPYLPDKQSFLHVSPHVEADTVKAGDPVAYFIKSKDLLDQA